jgi:hypothetical protein
MAGVFFATALGSTSAAADPSASDKETSRTLYADGMHWLDIRDYANAERACRGAHALVQAPTSAACWARGLEGLGRLVEARDAFLEASRYPQTATEPSVFTAARELSRTQAELLATRIPTLLLAVAGVGDPAALSATIDGAGIATETIGLPRKLDPGRHVIVVGCGIRHVRLEVDVQEGREARVPVDLGTDPGNAAVKHAEPNTPRSRTFVPLAYGAFGVGLVGLAIGAVSGLTAASKDNALAHECSGDVCPGTARADLEAFHSAKTISLVGYVFGAAGIAGGVTLWLASPRSASSVAARLWVAPPRAGIEGAF